MAKHFPDEFIVILHHELDIMMHPSAPRCTVSYFKSAYSLLDGLRKLKKLVLNIILAVCCDQVLEVWYTQLLTLYLQCYSKEAKEENPLVAEIDRTVKPMMSSWPSIKSIALLR